MRAISLFSGVGGFEIGFDRTGIETVLQCESDPWCLSVLARHWPDTERVTDVRSVGYRRESTSRDVTDGLCQSSKSWRRQTGAGLPSSVDLVYGGFPCQDVSVAGKRAGLRGDRSGLFYEFARVVRELRPRWFAFENVPGLLSSADGADFGAIVGTMVELGYGVAWRILDGRWFGVPQRRRRVLVVGCVGSAQRAAQVLAVCESCGGYPAPRSETREGVAYSLAASVRGTGNAWNSNYVAASLTSGGHPGSNMPGRHKEDDVNLVVARGQTARQERLAGDSDNFIIDGQNAAAVDEIGSLGTGSAHGNRGFMVAGALRASDGHHGHGSPRGDGSDNLIAFDANSSVPVNDSNVMPTLRHGTGLGIPHGAAAISSTVHGVRRLTPLECERLMGWPDEHTRWTVDGKEISDSHRYRMCGNGVIATVAEWLGWRLVRADAFLREERVA